MATPVQLLNELASKHGVQPVFLDEREQAANSNSPLFTCHVEISGLQTVPTRSAVGRGSRKKLARQQACRLLLEALALEMYVPPLPPTLNSASPSLDSTAPSSLPPPNGVADVSPTPPKTVDKGEKNSVAQ